MGGVKSAFVHFDYYYENELTDKIVSKLDNGESHRIYPACTISRHEYWILTNCDNPIQNTMMNTAQIVENCRFLENKIAEQSATIAKLEKGLDGVQSIVYQLLGGLFNQETQSEMLNIHLATLYGDTPPDVDHDEIIWPTTRQGDECQELIMKLESQLEMLNFTADPNVFDSIACARYSPNTRRMSISEFDDDDVPPQEAPQEDYSYDDCISLSTHSSMTELISYTDSDDESLSRRRRMVSQELCGNE